MSYSALSGGLGAETDDRRSQARAVYSEAENAYDAGDYRGAAKLFHRAYETFPLPPVLVAIAMSYREMGDMERAKQWSQRYLYADPSGPLAERAGAIKSDAEQALQAAASSTPEVPRSVPAQPLPTTQDAYPERASKAIWAVSGIGLVGLVGLGWYLTRSPKPVRANRRRRRRTSRR